MIETDADRSDMLRALGGQDDIRIRDVQILALYLQEPQRLTFADSQMSGYSHALRCLWSDVKRHEFTADDQVSIPSEGEFYIGVIENEDGMAVIELRKA